MNGKWITPFILAIAALTARGENPLAYPTVIPPPPVAPATPPAPPPAPGPDIFGPASDTGNANNTPAPPQQAGAKPDANADLPTETSLNCPAKFITCLAQDHQGNIWAGSEDDGCLRYTPPHDATPDAEGTWTQFTGADLGGDNSVYAIAVDKLNRVWCGTLNHGVAVYNGEKWQSYSVIADPTTGTLAGPLGARVFAIATSPLDGDIWIATDAGLSRYSLSKDTWSYYTRGMSAGSFVAETQGLPSDQIAGIAFTKKGRILLATQCDGVATADPVDGYKKFRNIRGPDLIPVTPAGDGLPTSLCNAILVAHDGTIYLATTTGLAFSKDDGDSWQYIRGKDYLDKDRGFLTPRGIVPASLATYNQLLTEDYITHITEDSPGRLWLAHRSTGYEAIDPQSTLKFTSNSDPKIREKNGYVTAILSYRNAGRSAGILPAERTPRSTAILPAERTPPRSTAIPPRSTAIPPANNQPAGRMPALHSTILLARYGAGLSQFNPPAPPPAEPRDSVAGAHKMKTTPGGLFLIPDDSPDSATNLPDATPPHANPNDHIFDADSANTAAPLPLAAKPPTPAELKALLAKLQTLPKAPLAAVYLSEDWNTLGDWLGKYGQQGGMLCGAGAASDHGMILDGPIKIDSEIGPHANKGDSIRLWIHWLKTDNPKSLYDPVVGYRRQSSWDDHGETYADTFEGPDIWIKVTVPEGIHRISLYLLNKDGHDSGRWSRDFLITLKAAGRNYAETDASPTLASARVCNFWSGVYKQFVVGKAGTYILKIQRDYSFDTIVSGVFIDRLKGPRIENDDLGLPWMGQKHYAPPDAGPVPATAVAKAANALWLALDSACDRQSAAQVLRTDRTLAYRAMLAEGASEQLLASWRWKLPALWTPGDRANLTQFEQQAYAAEQKVEQDARALTDQVVAHRRLSGVPRFAPGLEQIVNPTGAAENQKLYGP